MSDYRGTIKHAVHGSCKSQIHTSRVWLKAPSPPQINGCPTAYSLVYSS
jgi:hypothetical protein